ncbi:hypothetical protein GOODEAATRI_001442, partial [Goodea atripinnis]
LSYSLYLDRNRGERKHFDLSFYPNIDTSVAQVPNGPRASAIWSRFTVLACRCERITHLLGGFQTDHRHPSQLTLRLLCRNKALVPVQRPLDCSPLFLLQCPDLLPGPLKRNQRHDVTHLFGWRLWPGDARSRGCRVGTLASPLSLPATPRGCVKMADDGWGVCSCLGRGVPRALISCGAGAGPRPNSLNGLYLLHNEATLSTHPNSAHMDECWRY